MCPTNDFLEFATGGGANVESQASYAADPNLTLGNQPGIASSSFMNKTLRQANSVASQLAQFIANQTQMNVLDNGVSAQFLAELTAALKSYAPKTTRFTAAGSGTFNMTYIFQIASGNATANATYTNNGHTYTVTTTIAGATELFTTGTGDPTVGASQTLTKTGGAGDATLTMYAFRRAALLRGIVVGSGGGGGAAGAGTAGVAGSTSSFGTTLVSSNGGGGGPQGSSGGQGGGGAGSLGAASGRVQAGGGGGYVNGNGAALGGAPGGQNALSGGAPLGNPGNGGPSAIANTGCGGAGGGGDATHGAAAGGGAGAVVYFELTGSVLTGLVGSFAYVVGAKGTGGTGGFAGGGDGADGLVEVTEIF